MRGRGPLGWDARMAAFRGVTFGWTTIGLPQVLHVLPAFDLFHVPIESPVVYESQGRRSGADPGCGVLLRASVPYTSVHSAGRAFAFALRGGLVSSELESRTRPDGEARMRSAFEIPLVGAVREGLRSIVRELCALIPSLEDPSAASGPAITEARLIDWTADLICFGSPDRIALDPGEARMRVVEEWIEEHLDQPITLGTLCEVAGVCARSLQIGFQRRRGQSPLRYVTRRRLLRARLRLSNAAPSTSVTEIALSSGFSHFGRFSVLYRRTFGVTPSATRDGNRRE